MNVIKVIEIPFEVLEKMGEMSANDVSEIFKASVFIERFGEMVRNNSALFNEAKQRGNADLISNISIIGGVKFDEPEIAWEMIEKLSKCMQHPAFIEAPNDNEESDEEA